MWLRPIVMGPQVPQGEPQWPRVAQLFPASLTLATLAAQRMPFQPQPLLALATPQPLVGEPLVLQVAPPVALVPAVRPAPPSPRIIRGPRCTTQYTCKLCGMLHNRRAAAELHIEKVHWGRIFRCTTCGCRSLRHGDIVSHHARSGHEGVLTVYKCRPEGAELKDQIRSQPSAPRK